MGRGFTRAARRAVRLAAVEHKARIVALWEFPAQDYEAWKTLIADQPGCWQIGRDYEEYLALLAGIERDCRRDGRIVRRANSASRGCGRNYCNAAGPTPPRAAPR